jgi:hypothetical protein
MQMLGQELATQPSLLAIMRFKIASLQSLDEDEAADTNAWAAARTSVFAVCGNTLQH